MSFADLVKQGEPRMTDAEFAAEMWHHAGVLDLIGSGCLLATAKTLYEEAQDLPDVWTLESIIKMLQHYSNRLDAKAKEQMQL